MRIPIPHFLDTEGCRRMTGHLVRFPECVAAAKAYLKAENYGGPEAHMYSPPKDGDYVFLALVAGWDFNDSVAEAKARADAMVARCLEGRRP